MAHGNRMHVRLYQGFVVCKIVISCIKTKVGVGNGGTRHVDAVNNLLEEGGRVVVGVDVVNGEKWDGGRKAKCTAYLTKGINKSHDKLSNHMIKEQTIRNQS